MTGSGVVCKADGRLINEREEAYTVLLHLALTRIAATAFVGDHVVRHCSCRHTSPD
jgi:hypothetical protein